MLKLKISLKQSTELVFLKEKNYFYVIYEVEKL